MTVDDGTKQRVIDRVDRAMNLNDVQVLTDRPAVRREVARALAAEGIVLAPQAWARMVREILNEVTAPVMIREVRALASQSETLFAALAEALADAAVMHEQGGGRDG